MKFLAQAIGLVASAQSFIPCLLLGSIFTEAIAIPLHKSSLDDYSITSLSVPRDANLFPLLGQKIHQKSTRAVPPLKPQPKPITPADSINPADPDAPAPLTPENPADVNPPPVTKPNNPVDSVPAQPHLGQQAPKANAKPDPYGPVPTEAEIATLCTVPENKAVFWSGTTREQLRAYKAKHELVSDANAYPEGYTYTFRNIDDASIKEKDVEFAYRFSRVFARTAKGEVRLMVCMPKYQLHKHELTSHVKTIGAMGDWSRSYPKFSYRRMAYSKGRPSNRQDHEDCPSQS
jgi:hypothetical protein